MKKTILTIIATVFCGASAWAADFEVGGLYYNITSSAEPLTVEVTSQNNDYSNYDGLTEAKIPSKVTYDKKEYAVVAIGYEAFKYCTSLVSVTIPDCITRIGEGAFAGCAGLTSVKIPDNVARISDYVFSECSSLKSVAIPAGVTSIGDDAFAGCNELASITIPEGVMSIGERAFDSCFALESVQLPESVTSIASSTFRYCVALTSVTIPNTVTYIGDCAFYECSSITSINLPQNVAHIDENAFALCRKLTSVNIPTGVTTISKGTFFCCESLASIVIPDAVTCIGQEAFARCESLTSVEIPDNVTEIGSSAFRACTNLKSVKLPKNISRISNYTFSECVGLTSITIPESVISIGVEAFSSSGLSSLVIPQGVKYIESLILCDCKNLTQITIPEGITSIENLAFKNCVNLAEVVIPSTVTSISLGAFGDCENLKSITCRAKLPPELGDGVFDGVAATSVVVPCSSDGSVKESYKMTWGANFSYQEDYLYTFAVQSNDDTMGSVEILKKPECGNDEAIVKATAQKGYKFVTWSNASTQEQTTYSDFSGDVTAVAYFALEDADLSILSDNDAFWSYDKTAKTLSIHGYGVGRVDSVSNWGADLPVGEVEHVVVDDDVKYLDASVLEDFSALKDVSIPATHTSLYGYVFSDKSAVESIVVPEGVEVIEHDTFADFDNLTSVTLPSSLKSIEAKAFNNCSRNKPLTIILNSATLPEVDDDSFVDIPDETLFVVPCSLIYEYSNDLHWGIHYFQHRFTEYLEYVVKVKPNNPEYGMAVVHHQSSCGNPAMIEALPFEGFQFVKWSDGSTELIRSFEVDHDYDLIAEFELIKTPVHDIHSDPSAPNAVKTIIDGRLVIIRDDKMYGITGEVINGK